MEERKLTIPEIIRMMKWTQDEIAQMLECSPSTIRRKMSGDSDWTATDIRIILGASGVSLSQVTL